MDANNLADRIVSLITCGSLLTPMKEINKGELPDTPDLSIPQIVREPIIRLVDKNWGRFLATFQVSMTMFALFCFPDGCQ